VEDFYKKLYRSRQSKNNNFDFPTIIKNKLINESSKKLPDIIIKEVKNALKEIKNNKIPDENQIEIEAIS